MVLGRGLDGTPLSSACRTLSQRQVVLTVPGCQVLRGPVGLLHPHRIQSRSPALMSAASIPRRRRDNDGAEPFLSASCLGGLPARRYWREQGALLSRPDGAYALGREEWPRPARRQSGTGVRGVRPTRRHIPDPVSGEACGHQPSVTAGTVLHRRRTSLGAWCWAAYLVTTHTPEMSAPSQRQLGIRTPPLKRAVLKATGRERLCHETAFRPRMPPASEQLQSLATANRLLTATTTTAPPRKSTRFAMIRVIPSPM